VATSEELVSAICDLVAASPVAIPVTFANHGVEEVAALIGGVVETCFSRNLRLKEVVVGPELADELGLIDGGTLPHGDHLAVQLEHGLGRRVRFVRV
jgi:hypothetical protein